MPTIKGNRLGNIARFKLGASIVSYNRKNVERLDEALAIVSGTEPKPEGKGKHLTAAEVKKLNVIPGMRMMPMIAELQNGTIEAKWTLDSDEYGSGQITVNRSNARDSYTTTFAMSCFDNHAMGNERKKGIEFFCEVTGIDLSWFGAATIK